MNIEKLARESGIAFEQERPLVSWNTMIPGPPAVGGNHDVYLHAIVPPQAPTLAQLVTFAARVRDEALEEAAARFDRDATGLQLSDGTDMEVQGARACAELVRALKSANAQKAAFIVHPVLLSDSEVLACYLEMERLGTAEVYVVEKLDTPGVRLKQWLQEQGT
jgi:hypothetical protein